MTYDGRVEIHLGSILQIDEKMRMVKELLYNGYIEDTEYVTLNVSDTSRAIQRPITTAPVITAPVAGESDDESSEDGEGSEDGENADENADTTAE